MKPRKELKKKMRKIDTHTKFETSNTAVLLPNTAGLSHYLTARGCKHVTVYYWIKWQIYFTQLHGDEKSGVS